ncbi:MAG: hypothetical protein J6T74_00920, partial [Clostridia bacterium]|nr:hypothetical protein [Clostridia bacterium]
DDDKLFIIAHELMHVKFEHMYRIMGKDGQRRDPELWNQATDAIINANLERDGFKIKEGYVNMPEALNYSAEEFYEKLLREKQAEQQQSGNNGQQSQNGQQQQGQQSQGQSQNGQQSQEQNGQGSSEQNQGDQGQSSKQSGNSGEQNQGGQQQEQSAGSGSGEQFTDDHSLWEKAFEESQEQGNGQKKQSAQNGGQNQSQSSKNSQLDPNARLPEFDESQFDERAEFQENRQERRERARRNMERMRDQELKKSESGNIEFGDVGEAKPILDWKLLLRREVEKTETIWSQRKSIAENNYAYRLEENDALDQAETEVMIDVSGSVSLEMVKAFLRQLKPILKESKLKVGCFNEKFWGMVEIKSNKDIDNFKIPSAARGRSAWTEDWDLAVRSFSKKREVNKIVFTDGEPCPGTMPKKDLKGTNVIWLVYSNRDFHPCCGKVINVYPKDLQNLINAERAAAGPELSM